MEALGTAALVPRVHTPACGSLAALGGSGIWTGDGNLFCFDHSM